MPKPHATVDHSRQIILNHLATAILNLAQAQKDISEAEPEEFMGKGRDYLLGLERLSQNISINAGNFVRQCPAS